MNAPAQTVPDAAALTGDHLDTYGESGLLDMPDARMMPDGQISLTAAGIDAGQRIVLGFQALPWLEMDYRYSRIPRLNPGDSTLYDRSLGFKIRLFEETHWKPDISLGIRDIIGTGVYGAEYVAATKRLADIEVTGGVGWGRLAGNATFPNPLGAISQSFDERPPISGGGGLVDFRQLFHGANIGVFGGANWRTPIDNLTLTVEYSSDRYAQEQKAGDINVRMPMNFGLSYKLFDAGTLSVGWFYGSTVGAILSLSLDPTTEGYAARLSPDVPPPSERTPQQRQDAVSRSVISRVIKTLDPNAHIGIDHTTLMIDMRAGGKGRSYCRALARMSAGLSVTEIGLLDLDEPHGIVTICTLPEPQAVADSGVHSAVASAVPAGVEAASAVAAPHPPGGRGFPALVHLPVERIRSDAAKQDLRLETVFGDGTELWLYYTNQRYEFEDEAIGRLLRVLMADAPSSIETFHLVPVYAGMPTQDVRIVRSAMERIVLHRGTAADEPGIVEARPAPIETPELDTAQLLSYPRFSWSLAPNEQTSFFDPHSPVRIRLFGSASGKLDISPGLAIEGSYELTAYDTFTTATLPESQLPHVRTDIAQYFTKGRNGFSMLDGVWHARLAPDLFAEAKAGYLEDMFGGAGGQLLWRPEASRFALGADVYEVWQRNFDRLFGFQNYHVLTGHLTVYYRSPWYGLDMAVHAGRYLAGDYGATFEVSREFATGVQIGAYATFTNVPFSQFGEGGFDKGIFLRIPLEWALPLTTQSENYVNIESLTRDGGQRLENDDSLYQETKRTSFDDISLQQQRIVSP